VIDLDRDLKIASLIVATLKAYLLSDQLYWSLDEIGPITYPFPKGTLGGLFLRLRRLESFKENLAPNQYQHLVTLQATMAQQLRQWTVQSENKAVLEIEARLQNWLAYLEDLVDNPRRYGPEYPTQVEGRTIIELLLDFAGDRQDVRIRLDGFDQQLRGMVVEDTFVWNESLVSAFPPNLFWWLYVSPRL
jgi:hypothetical protein